MNTSVYPIAGMIPLPLLPIVLWKTPPGLEMILAQEGVPTVKVDNTTDSPIVAGRFVVVDRRKVHASEIHSRLSSHHVVIDSDTLLDRRLPNTWADLIDTRSTPAEWSVDGARLVERVSRTPRAALRKALIQRLRNKVCSEGGLWVRKARYPANYRSAFNLRVDLDEHVPTDYFRFAQARTPIADCTTHFVSTRAYGENARVLDDLRPLDSQSHAHHHFIYRDPEANAKNLNRADRILRERGFAPTGFAAPHGRWNQGLDQAIENLGYLYSSDFQLGYDDVPFFPWVGSRFSRVLQVPIHPVCEGLFLDAGIQQASSMAGYFADVVRRKLSHGEPAFVYGHPERRLGRYPEIVRAISQTVDEFPMAWRVTLTEFARWWTWRGERSWTLTDRGEGRFEIVTDDWDTAYPMTVEIVRGRHLARVTLNGPRKIFRLDEFAYEQFSESPAVGRPAPCLVKSDLRSMVRAAIDWETVTPIEDLPTGTILGRIKRQLRKHRDRVA